MLYTTLRGLCIYLSSSIIWTSVSPLIKTYLSIEMALRTERFVGKQRKWREKKYEENQVAFIDPTRQYPDPDCLLDWWCRHRIHLSFRPSRMALTSRLQRGRFMRFYLCIRNFFPSHCVHHFIGRYYLPFASDEFQSFRWIPPPSPSPTISIVFHKQERKNSDDSGGGVAKIHNKYFSSEMNLSNGLALPESKYVEFAGGWSSFFYFDLFSFGGMQRATWFFSILFEWKDFQNVEDCEIQ